MVEVLLFVPSDTQSFQIILNADSVEDALVMRRATEWILRHFGHLVPANERDVVFVVFVLNRQRVLNAGKLDQAAEDRRIALYSLTSLGQTRLDRVDILLAALDLDIKVRVLSLMLGQEVFEILMNSVQESVYLLERRLCQVLDRSHAVVNHICQLLALI